MPHDTKGEPVIPLLPTATAVVTAATLASGTPASPAKHGGDDPLQAAVKYPQRLSAFVQRLEAREARREAKRQARQAERAAKAAAEAATAVPVPTTPGRTGDPTPHQWAVLRDCESGGNYRIVSSNGLWFGAYQFTLGTWGSYGPAGNPAQASPAEQDRRALALWRSRGWQPWPVCGPRAASAG